MKSMTGFGRGMAQTSQFQCVVEVKSVNARYCDIYIKVPRLCQSMEERLRQGVRDCVSRGKIEVTVQLTEVGERAKKISMNHTFVSQLKDMLVQEGFYQTPDEVSVEALLGISNDWVRIEDETIDEGALESALLSALQQAMEELVAMRQSEGNRLAVDIQNRLATIATVEDEIEQYKDSAVALYKEKMWKRLEEIMEHADLEVSMDRFLQEVALLADKTDISEEIVRLRSHVLQCKEIMEDSNPVGRKLDFLIQEMNREVNTMGSKGAHLEILNRVVLLKCEIEKIREQVQNIE